VADLLLSCAGIIASAEKSAATLVFFMFHSFLKLMIVTATSALRVTLKDRKFGTAH